MFSCRVWERIRIRTASHVKDKYFVIFIDIRAMDIPPSVQCIDKYGVMI